MSRRPPSSAPTWSGLWPAGSPPGTEATAPAGSAPGAGAGDLAGAPGGPLPAGTPGAHPSGAGAWSPLPASLADAELRPQFLAARAAGLHGLCFSPYLAGQGPGSQIEAPQIAARLAHVRPWTRWVRTFSCTDGHQHTPALARALGLRTLVGAWLGTDAEINERELRGLIEVGQAGHADLLAVGNEVLLREDLPEEALIEAIERVRAAVPGVPVGYVDAYYLFERHPRVTAACDVLLSNCYPFWEGCPREQAVPYMQQMVERVRAVAGGRPVVVSETGWPDRGSPFHGALPSPENAMRYFIDTQNWSRATGTEVFWFAAFDESWKVGAEGDVGAFWGLWDQDGREKFA